MFIYAAAAPNPIGVGQPITIVTWTAEMPPDIGETAGTVVSPGTRAGWYGITLSSLLLTTLYKLLTATLYRPSRNHTITYFHQTKSEHTHVQTRFPATWKNSTTMRRLYAAADSRKLHLSKQESNPRISFRVFHFQQNIGRVRYIPIIVHGVQLQATG